MVYQKLIFDRNLPRKFYPFIEQAAKEKQTICAIIFYVIARAAHSRPKQSLFERLMPLDEILPVWPGIASLRSQRHVLMPLKTPSSASKSGSVGKPKGKSVTSTRGKGENKPAPKKKTQSAPPVPVRLSWWQTLTPERKLDVVGAIMAVVGMVILLVLFSAQRSELTGNIIRVLGQILGWGIYVLPIALIGMGLWLILRRIEKLPPLSLERATGFLLFFLWLLTMMHSIIASPEMAGQAAIDGAGGGYIGSLFEKA